MGYKSGVKGQGDKDGAREDGDCDRWCVQDEVNKEESDASTCDVWNCQKSIYNAAKNFSIMKAWRATGYA